MNKLKREDIPRIAERYEAGEKAATIAASYGVSVSTVQWHCLRQGALTPKFGGKNLGDRGPLEVARGNHVVRRFTPTEDETIVAMSIAGHGPAAIAKAVGRRCNSIIGRLATLARREEFAK